MAAVTMTESTMEQFYSILQDLTGNNRLESEDPKWSQLFNSVDFCNLQGDSGMFLQQGSRLIANCGRTQNLQMLLEQTVGRLEQIVSLKYNPSKAAIKQCCGALHLSALIINYLVSHLTNAKLGELLGLPSEPGSSVIGRQHFVVSATDVSLRGSSALAFNDGEALVINLIKSVLASIEMFKPNEAWAYDICFFCSNLLLSLFSCQLYINVPVLVAAIGEEIAVPVHVGHNSQSIEVNVVGNFALGAARELFASEMRKPHSGVRTLEQSLTCSSRLLYTRQTFIDYVYHILEPKIAISSLVADENMAAPGKGRNLQPINAKRFLVALMKHIMEGKAPPPESIAAQLVTHHKKYIGTAALLAEKVKAVLNVVDASQETHFNVQLDEESSVSLQLEDLIYNLGHLITIPLKAIQALILKVNPKRAFEASHYENNAEEFGSPTRSEYSPTRTTATAGSATSPSRERDRTRNNKQRNPIVQVVKTSRRLPEKPLVERCTEILLLLLLNKRSDYALAFYNDVDIRTLKGVVGSPNIMRCAFNSIIDDPSAPTTTGGPSSVQVDGSSDAFPFRSIVHYLAKDLVQSESACLLLYNFMHHHPKFLQTLLADRSYSEMVLVALLKRMYLQEEVQRLEIETKNGKRSNDRVLKTSKALGPNRWDILTDFPTPVEPLYVTVMNVMMLIQDPAFARSLFPKTGSPQSGGKGKSSGGDADDPRRNEAWRSFTDLAWYKEHSLGSEVCLGDVVILCALKSGLHALFRQHDQFLLSNCLAILSNLGPYISGISSYTAERLIGVVQKVGKRIIETEVKKNRMIQERINNLQHHAAAPRHESNVDTILHLHSSVANGAGSSSPSPAAQVPHHRSSFSAAASAIIFSEPDRSKEAEIEQVKNLENFSQSYIEMMRGLQEQLRVLLTLICRSIRPSKQVSNIHLMYAMVRGGDAFCDIVEDPFMSDIFHATNLDEFGLAHLELDATSEKRPNRRRRGSLQGFAGRIGDFVASAVNPNHYKKKIKKLNLPPVTLDAAILPLPYIPVLVRRGIKYMDKARHTTVSFHKHSLSVAAEASGTGSTASGSGATTLSREVSPLGSGPSSPDMTSPSAVGSGGPGGAVGGGTTLIIDGTIVRSPSKSSMAEAADRFQDEEARKSSQQAVNDLTSWLKLEATDIFQTAEECQAAGGDSDAQSAAAAAAGGVKGARASPPSRRNSSAQLPKKLPGQSNDGVDLGVRTAIAERQPGGVADDVDSTSPMSSGAKSPTREMMQYQHMHGHSHEDGDLIHHFNDVEFPSFNYFDHPSSEFYLYREEDHAEEFFVPYTWSIVMRSSPEISWNIEEVSTVDVSSAGLLHTLCVLYENPAFQTAVNVLSSNSPYNPSSTASGTSATYALNTTSSSSTGSSSPVPVLGSSSMFMPVAALGAPASSTTASSYSSYSTSSSSSTFSS